MLLMDPKTQIHSQALWSPVWDPADCIILKLVETCKLKQEEASYISQISKRVVRIKSLFSVFMCAQSLQSCAALCDLWSRPPGSSVHGILQARTLEWVAVASSRESSQLRNQTHISCVSCIAGRFFTHWATWEAQYLYKDMQTS